MGQSIAPLQFIGHYCFTVQKVTISEAESQGIYEEYDGEYEQYEEKNVEKDTEVREKVSNESMNQGKEEVYEEYDGNYEAYNPKYAKYLKVPNTQRQVVCRKFTKKKWVILLVIALLAISGIAVGLSVHFTSPSPESTASFKEELITTTTVVSMTTATIGILL